MKVMVRTLLRSGVLDIEGKTIAAALRMLSYDDVSSLRIGRFFEIELTGDLTEDEARKQVKAMCEASLVNTIMEDYEIEIEGKTA